MKRALVLVMLAGCGSGHDPSTGPGSAALVSIIAGGSQRAVVGEELPGAIVVRATNGKSVPVPDQLINFVVVTGGGSVFAGSALTNQLGEARERWTLGPTAGEQAIEARAIDQASGDPIVFARITATADPGPAMTMELSEIEHQMRIGDRLDVASLTAVLDQYGNVIGEAPISVSATPPFEIQGTTVASGAEHQGPITIQSGLAGAVLTLTVLRDLSALVGATGSYGCHGLMVRQNGPADIDPRGVVTDYQGTFVVDSALYPGAGGTTASLWITNGVTMTREDGSVEAVPENEEALQVLQSVGKLYLGVGIGLADLTSESPLTYRGDAYCPDWWLVSSFEPWIMTK